MKKVGIITNLYPPYVRGGAEKIAAKQAEILSEEGYDVFVISTHPKFFSSQKKENNITVYRFRPFNLFYYLNDFKFNFVFRLFWRIIDTYNIFSAFRVMRILQKERSDVIITHNLVGIGLLTTSIIKFLGIKHVHVLHDVQLVKPSGILNNVTDPLSFLERMYIRLVSRIFKFVDICVSPSQAVLSYHNQHGLFLTSNNYVIKNPLTMNVLENPMRENKKRLLYIGQLEEHKGIFKVIEQLENEYSGEYTLDIAGDGSLVGAIKIIAENSENITYHGMVSHEKVVNLIQNSSYVLVPSITFENSPTVIYESFSNGVPIIASNIGGIPELVKDNETGFLIKDIEKAYKVIDEALNISDTTYLELSKNCLKFASDNSIKEYTRKLKRLL